MRIDFHAVHFVAPEDLRPYAEKRLWQATRQWQHRVAWIGIWFIGAEEDPPELAPETAGLICRLDAWVSGVGIVTVRHQETNAFVAVDIAAARLEQSIHRKMREVARTNWRQARRERLGHPVPPPASATPRGPRLALLLERNGLPRRLSAQPWLRAKYGVEQIVRVGLPAHLWHAASEHNGLAEELRYRVAKGLQGRPELIVVLGRSNPHDDPELMDQEQQRVRRIGAQLRQWDLPLEVVTLWTAEAWGEACNVTSMELSPLPAEPRRTVKTPIESEVMSCA